MINHDIKSDGLDTHKGEYWYKCSLCGKSDWIASYGKVSELNFYNKPCVSAKDIWDAEGMAAQFGITLQAAEKLIREFDNK